MRGRLGEELAGHVNRRWVGAVLLGILGVLGGCSGEPGGHNVMPTASASGQRPEFGWAITADNVGLRSRGLSCAELAEYEGSGVVPRGTTISQKRITRPLDLSEGWITIERSCVQPVTVGRGLPAVTTTNLNTLTTAQGPVEIRDSEFDGGRLEHELAAMSTAFVGAANVRNTYFHGFGSGIALIDTGDESDIVIEHNYVTDLLAWGDGAKDGNHSDAFTVREFSAAARPERRLVIRNNRFDCDSGNDTGALFVQSYAGPIDNALVQGNLLEGGGYQLGLNETNHPYQGLSAVNNRFTGTGYGPAYVQGGAGWDEWKDNYLFAAGAGEARGKAVPRP